MPHQRPAACIIHTVRMWHNHSQCSCATLPAGTAPVAMGSSARPQHREGQHTTACFHCCTQKLVRNSVLATGEPCSPQKHKDTSAKIPALSQSGQGSKCREWADRARAQGLALRGAQQGSRARGWGFVSQRASTFGGQRLSPEGSGTSPAEETEGHSPLPRPTQAGSGKRRGDAGTGVERAAETPTAILVTQHRLAPARGAS